jgi:4a-hydroxytetrahydrobiopterin dehydratase
MDRLTADEAKALLRSTPGWALDGDAIRRKFTFPGFADAVAFVVRVGFDAEAADHHPDILVNYKRVTLTYSTHSAGGLTDKDFAGAAKANELARAMGAVEEMRK